VQCVATSVSGPSDVQTALTTLSSEPGGGLIVSADAFTTSHRELFIEPANSYKILAIYLPRIFAVEGGLISYGPDYIVQFKQAAIYVDQILRGGKPSDLPIQEPTKFQLVINLKTAKALGLSVPLTIQMIADEVIE